MCDRDTVLSCFAEGLSLRRCEKPLGANLVQALPGLLAPGINYEYAEMNIHETV